MAGLAQQGEEVLLLSSRKEGLLEQGWAPYVHALLQRFLCRRNAGRGASVPWTWIGDCAGGDAPPVGRLGVYAWHFEVRAHGGFDVCPVRLAFGAEGVSPLLRREGLLGRTVCLRSRGGAPLWRFR